MVPVGKHQGTVQEVATELTDRADPQMIEADSLDVWALVGTTDPRCTDRTAPGQRAAIHQLNLSRALPNPMNDHQTDTSEGDHPWPNQ